MENTVFFLSSCSTCSRILKEIPEGVFSRQDIKKEKISEGQLEEMKSLSGSYESLFSRRSMKYKSMGLKDRVLAEEDYKRLILEEYTFLKRPVFVYGEKVFVGNSSKIVESLKAELGVIE